MRVLSITIRGIMSSLGFFDYANISTYGMMGLFNASLSYLNGSNGSAPGLVGGQLVGGAGMSTNFGPFGASNGTGISGSLSANFSSAGSVLLSSSPASLANGSILEYGLEAGSASASSVGQVGFPTANLSFPESNLVHKEFIFDRTDVRVIFITLYSLVFCCCFFGKC